MISADPDDAAERKSPEPPEAVSGIIERTNAFRKKEKRQPVKRSDELTKTHLRACLEREDGAFRFTVERNEFDRTSSSRPWDDSVVVAVTDGHGLGVPATGPGTDLVKTGLAMRLAKDDSPVAGRILDMQGPQPVAVRVESLYWPAGGGDLTAWLADLNRKRGPVRPCRCHSQRQSTNHRDGGGRSGGRHEPLPDGEPPRFLGGPVFG